MYGDLSSAIFVTDKPSSAVKAGEVTRTQYAGMSVRSAYSSHYGGTNIGMGCECGGVIGNNQFDGDDIKGMIRSWDRLFRASYSSYRLMRSQPTIALARSMVMSLALTSQWVLEVKPGTPEAWVRYARDNIQNRARCVKKDALRALDNGWSPFELLWNYDTEMSKWTISKHKSLTVDQTDILEDEKGNFTGLRQYNVPDIGTGKSWVYTNDKEGSNKFGRSRFENIRLFVWPDWLNIMWNLRKMRYKISGILPMVFHPPGEDEDGVEFATHARNAVIALQKGEGITMEHIGIDLADIRNKPELLKTALVGVEFYDAGSTAEAQAGMLAQLKYQDANFFRGYLRPERSGQEGEHGTKADAGVHTDSALSDIETIDDDIADQYSESDGPLNTEMTLNFGEKARNAIRVKPGPIRDKQKAIFKALLDGLLRFPQIAVKVAKVTNMKSVFKGLDIDVDDDLDIDKEFADIPNGIDQRAKNADPKGARTDQPTNSPKPEGKPVGTPGNGTGNGNGTATEYAQEQFNFMMMNYLQQNGLDLDRMGVR